MRSISLMLAICLIFSCSKTVHVTDDNYEAVRIMINQEALQKTCHMSYNEEKSVEAHALNMGKDSVRFVTGDYKLMQFPVSDLRSVSFTDRAGGAADGALSFFVAGSLFGVMQLASNTEGDVPFIGYCLFAAIYGLPFSAAGILGGAIVGRNNVFDFSGMNMNVQTDPE